MAQWENRALIDLKVAGSNPAGQLLIYFHNVFPVLTKTLCRHASLVPTSCIKAFMRKPRRCSRRPSAPPDTKYSLIRASWTASASLLKFPLYDFHDHDNDWARFESQQEINLNKGQLC